MGVEVEKSLDDLYERVAGFEEFGERLDSLEAQGEQIHDMLVEVLSCLNREHYSSGSRNSTARLSTGGFVPTEHNKRSSTRTSLGAVLSAHRRGSYMDALVTCDPRAAACAAQLPSLCEGSEREGGQGGASFKCTPPQNVENPAEGEVVPIDPKDTGDPDASMLLVDASKPIGSPPNGSSPTRNLVPRNNSVARKSKRGSLIARVRSRWRNAKTQVVEEWRKEHPNAQKPMAAALTRIVKEAKLKDEETKRAGETREDRLKDFLTQDKDVERLLIRIRKEDLEREKREQKQKVWEKEQQLSAKFIVLPDSKVKRYWELYVLFMVVASLLLVPMDIAFQLSVDTSSGGTGLYFFMFFVFSDCTFIADLVLSFRTAVTREEHELVKRPALIAFYYLHGWFFSDFIVSIPFDAIFHIAKVNHLWYLHLLKLLRMFRVFKLIRILKKVRQRIEASDAVLDLVLGVCFLLFIFHLLGNVYLVITREEIKDRISNFTSDDEAELVAKALVFNNQWMLPKQYFYVANGKVLFYGGTYFFAIWWAMCAMSGAQVSIPQTDAETLFTFLVVFLGFFVNAYVIGSFTTALAQLSAAINKAREKRDFIDQYMRHKRIPAQLRTQIKQFYQFAGSDEDEDWLDQLPLTLRLQFDLCINRNLFLKVPFFKNCDISQISVLVPRIQREYAWPGKTVISEGSIPTGLYMIGRGFVKVSVQGQLKELLTHPDFFGEQALTDTEPSKLTVTTITLCQFMLLTREQFEEVLDLYPSMKKALQRYATNKAKQAKNTTSEAEGALNHLMTIKLELQQHGHLLSAQGRRNLNEEIQNLESEKSTALHSSPRERNISIFGGIRRDTGRVAPNAHLSGFPDCDADNPLGVVPGARAGGRLPKCC